MFSLSIALGSVQWRLLFKTEEAARNIAEAIQKKSASVLADDFGQQIVINANSYHGMLLEDMDKTKLAGVELMLQDARIRAAATKQAQSDQSLKTGGGIVGANHGVPMMTPIPGQRGF